MLPTRVTASFGDCFFSSLHSGIGCAKSQLGIVPSKVKVKGSNVPALRGLSAFQNSDLDTQVTYPIGVDSELMYKAREVFESYLYILAKQDPLMRVEKGCMMWTLRSPTAPIQLSFLFNSGKRRAADSSSSHDGFEIDIQFNEDGTVAYTPSLSEFTASFISSLEEADRLYQDGQFTVPYHRVHEVEDSIFRYLPLIAQGWQFVVKEGDEYVAGDLDRLCNLAFKDLVDDYKLRWFSNPGAEGEEKEAAVFSNWICKKFTAEPVMADQLLRWLSQLAHIYAERKNGDQLIAARIIKDIKIAREKLRVQYDYLPPIIVSSFDECSFSAYIKSELFVGEEVLQHHEEVYLPQPEHITTSYLKAAREENGLLNFLSQEMQGGLVMIKNDVPADWYKLYAVSFDHFIKQDMKASALSRYVEREFSQDVAMANQFFSHLLAVVALFAEKEALDPIQVGKIFKEIKTSIRELQRLHPTLPTWEPALPPSLIQPSPDCHADEVILEEIMLLLASPSQKKKNKKPVKENLEILYRLLSNKNIEKICLDYARLNRRFISPSKAEWLLQYVMRLEGPISQDLLKEVDVYFKQLPEQRENFTAWLKEHPLEEMVAVKQSPKRPPPLLEEVVKQPVDPKVEGVLQNASVVSKRVLAEEKRLKQLKEVDELIENGDLILALEKLQALEVPKGTADLQILTSQMHQRRVRISKEASRFIISNGTEQHLNLLQSFHRKAVLLFEGYHEHGGLDLEPKAHELLMISFQVCGKWIESYAQGVKVIQLCAKRKSSQQDMCKQAPIFATFFWKLNQDIANDAEYEDARPVIEGLTAQLTEQRVLSLLKGPTKHTKESFNFDSCIENLREVAKASLHIAHLRRGAALHLKDKEYEKAFNSYKAILAERFHEEDMILLCLAGFKWDEGEKLLAFYSESLDEGLFFQPDSHYFLAISFQARYERQGAWQDLVSGFVHFGLALNAGKDVVKGERAKEYQRDFIGMYHLARYEVIRNNLPSGQDLVRKMDQLYTILNKAPKHQDFSRLLKHLEHSVNCE
jgi:hypothetical protein